MIDNFSFLRMITGGLSAYIQEDKILYDALCEHLGREPQMADYVKCIVKVTNGRLDEYLFCYKNVELGRVVRELRMDQNTENKQYRMVHEVKFYPAATVANPTNNPYFDGQNHLHEVPRTGLPVH